MVGRLMENAYICRVKRTIAHSLRAVWLFYYDGFRHMTWGRTLWIIIVIKLAVMFLVLRLFFFRPALEGQSDAQRQETVGGNLTREPVPTQTP